MDLIIQDLPGVRTLRDLQNLQNLQGVQGMQDREQKEADQDASSGVSRTGETVVVSDNGTIKNCIGCYGCWVKTPGQCVIKDEYQQMGALLSEADRVMIFSRCLLGGYSPFIKNVLDRSISYLLPFFKAKGKETHHQQRYPAQFALEVHFYGENLSDREKSVAEKLVQANAVNFDASSVRVTFSEKAEEAVKEAVIA